MSNIIKDSRILKEISSKVDSVTEAKEIIEKLEKELKKHSNGYGLSAIQIGIPKAISIIKYDRHEQEFIVLINPEFIEKGEEFVFYGEGCLSFPDVYMQTIRHKDFIIKNSVIDGDTFREEKQYYYYSEDDNASRYESVAVEHEIDHQLGLTIYDYGKVISPPVPITRDTPKISRNDPCPCGSGKKYKKCCINT
jgi:peptide deformylase